MGQIKLISVRAGQLPVPRSLLESWMSRQVPGMTEAVQRMAQIQFGVREMNNAGRSCGRSCNASAKASPFRCATKWTTRNSSSRNCASMTDSLTVVLAR